jgi:hypothetical protein
VIDPIFLPLIFLPTIWRSKIDYGRKMGGQKNEKQDFAAGSFSVEAGARGVWCIIDFEIVNTQER